MRTVLSCSSRPTMRCRLAGGCSSEAQSRVHTPSAVSSSHSCRCARTGSSLETRLAGTNAAAHPMSSCVRVTAARLRGSSASTPKSHARVERDTAAAGCQYPNRMDRAGTRMTQDPRDRGPKGPGPRDLGRGTRDRVATRTVEPVRHRTPQTPRNRAAGSYDAGGARAIRA